MFKVLSTAVLAKDGIDDLFEEHYESDDGLEKKTQLGDELYVKAEAGSQDGGNQRKQAAPDNEKDKEMKQFLNARSKFLFKKKIKKTEKKQFYSRIQLLIKLRVMKGPLFVHCLLEGIRLSKEIFLAELEMGREVVIPQELNIKEMPFCFQYYDGVLEIICKSLSGEQKVFINRID
jgi:hypothetical protein